MIEGEASRRKVVSRMENRQKAENLPAVGVR
jgi:hypothetical protein